MFNSRYTPLPLLAAREVAADSTCVAALVEMVERLRGSESETAKHAVFVHGGSAQERLLAVRTAARQAQIKVYSFDATDMAARKVGAKVQKSFIQLCLRTAVKNAPAIVFVEALNASPAVLLELITAMEAPSDSQPRPAVLYVCSANKREDVDVALLRQGRANTHFDIED